MAMCARRCSTPRVWSSAASHYQNGMVAMTTSNRTRMKAFPSCANETNEIKSRVDNFRLAFLSTSVKSKTLFENDGRFVRLYHCQTSGNPVRIGDGYATVTNYKLPRP